jgi:hypothetical protein
MSSPLQPGRGLLLVVRVGVPLAMIAGGIVWAAVEGGPVGAGAAIVLIGGGILVWLSNLIFRLGLASNRDRRREERARRSLWPRRDSARDHEDR